jgi:hypothetical protein
MAENKAQIVLGGLDVMVLKTLTAVGPFDSHGIARRMEQISEHALEINRGTIYASPVRLQLRRLRFVGKQPQGEVLLHRKSGPQAAFGSGGDLGGGLQSDWPCAADRRTELNAHV